MLQAERLWSVVLPMAVVGSARGAAFCSGRALTQWRGPGWAASPSRSAASRGGAPRRPARTESGCERGDGFWRGCRRGCRPGHCPRSVRADVVEQWMVLLLLLMMMMVLMKMVMMMMMMMMLMMMLIMMMMMMLMTMIMMLPTVLC